MTKFLFFLFFICFGSAFSQNYSFVSYSTSEGLPQSQVSAISEDFDGYLWVGTFGGLAKFNGKDFTTYSSESGLLNNRITCLSVIDGNLWIGHEGGVSCYNKSSFQTWAFTEEDKTNNVKSIIKFNGKIIIASNGSGLYKIENSLLKKFPNKNENYYKVRDLLICKDEVYLATNKGVFRTKDFTNFSPIQGFVKINISGLDMWGDNLVVSTFHDGLYKYSFTSKNVVKIDLKLSLNEFSTVFVDSKYNCWASSSSGVVQIELNGKISLIDESKGLPIGTVSSVFEDRNANIWIGTYGKGLLRFPGNKFIYYNTSSGLSSDLIVSVNQDKNGAIWLGSFDKGLMTLSRNGSFSYIELVDNQVWASCFHVNNFNWFGTKNGLVQMFQDQITKVFHEEDGLPGDIISTFYKVNASQMYVGGDKGVSLYKNGKFIFLNKGKNQQIGSVRSLSYFNKELFCGTSKGMYVYRKGVFIRVKNIHKRVACIKKDESNNLWIGTEDGLFIYSRNQVRQISISPIPSSNLINFLNYKNGKIYVGTNNGLFVISNYAINKKIKITHFGKDDGLVDLETNNNSSFFDDKGCLWFGTSSGLVKYTEFKNQKVTFLPEINLRSILLNYEAFDYSKYSEKLDENGLPLEMILPFNKNNLIFEIDAVSLVNHSHLNYQFWLEGLDETWSPITKNTLISFTALSAGHYILHARAIDVSGVYTDEISIPFDINPPFYKSWWFILFSLLIIGFITYQLFKFKLKRETEKSQVEMAEYKSKLMSLEQKSLNASMNRHFIFNSLNSIQYFINSQDRLSANRYLTNFAKLIRKNLDSTNEEGNMITLTQELEGLELYLSLESMRFKDRFDYVISCEDIDTESVVLPAMLLQPFIENSIIHGILPIEDKKGLISILITKNENILSIQIDDNGVGIKNSLLQKHDSNGDHKSQGMEITAKRIDLIKKISNKGFEIIGPIQINESNTLINGTRVLLKIPFENLED